MKAVFSKLKKYFKMKQKVLLPQGATEFHKWADEVIELAGLPNNDTIKGALASMVHHEDARVAIAPREIFVRRLQKAAANEVAFHIVEEINKKRAEVREAAKKAEVVTEKAETGPEGAG